jgi:hypothetical protein
VVITAPTTPVPSANPTLITPAPSSARAAAIQASLAEVTDESILLDPTSPQGQAMSWLVSSDPAKVDPSTYSTFHQRYSLATLYFATNGDDWIFDARWITEFQECSWLALSCNNDFAVTEIQLGTLKELASLLFSLFFLQSN